MFCNKCGNYVDENSGVKFCNKCGNDLTKLLENVKNDENQATIEEAEKSVEKIEEKVEAPKETIEKNNVVREKVEVSEEVKKSRKRKLWAAIIISCAVWMLLCFGVIMLVKNAANNIKDEVTNVIETTRNNTESGNLTSNNNANSKSDVALSKEESAKKFKEEGKRIGSEDYGYVSVPKNWTRFYDADASSTLQYSYANVWIVTLYAVDAEQMDALSYASGVYNSLEEDGVEGLLGGKLTINDHNAYQVTCYYKEDNVYLACWFIEGNDGKTHYVAVEGPDSSSDYFYNIVLTFAEDE